MCTRTSCSKVWGERASRHSVHYVKHCGCVLCAFYLLVLQWIGSSCFVSQQKAEIINRIWINKTCHYFDNLTVLFFLFFVLLKSMGGTIPPAPASASAEETSKVRYKKIYNWKLTFALCKNYWAGGGRKLLSVFTQIG